MPDAADDRALHVEERIVDEAGGWRRGGGAFAALLDHDDDHVLGVVDRRKARIPGVVALAGDLGGTGLAGDGHGIRAKDAVRRAGRRRGRLAQGAAQKGQVTARDAQAARGGEPEVLQGCTLWRVYTQAQVRRDGVAAVGDGRVVDRHLKGCGQQIALADRQVYRVARLPESV